MADVQKSQSRASPSAFTSYSNAALSPSISFGIESSVSPSFASGVSQSLPGRTSSAFRQSSNQYAEKQQEEAYFADLLSYR